MSYETAVFGQLAVIIATGFLTGVMFHKRMSSFSAGLLAFLATMFVCNFWKLL